MWATGQEIAGNTRQFPRPTRSVRLSLIATARSGIGSIWMTSPLGHPVEEPIVRFGELIDGRYRAGKTIGAGGMSVVVAAWDIRFGRRVAVKVPRPETCRRKDLLARFRREVRTVGRLNSEHVVRVSDAGELATGVPYMVMEFLEGYDLGALLKKKGPLPLDEGVRYVLQTVTRSKRSTSWASSTAISSLRICFLPFAPTAPPF